MRTLIVLAFALSVSAGEPLLIADRGRALTSVIISASASDATKAAAAELADYLGRIAGAKFGVETGDGSSGIAVGRATDFPWLTLAAKWDANDPMLREDYILRSHTTGAHLIGVTDLAVSHAVWDLLYRLGYRQFFPGKAWEVMPHTPHLEVAVDVVEHPAYQMRQIWYGFGTWGYNDTPYAEWCRKNRAMRGIELNSGHAYDGILSRHKAVFDAHPEYLGLLDGERKSTKFCISNPALRKLVVDDAVAQIAKKPNLDCISVEPSDGGGWCECENCAKIGSITDRALLLANNVAEAVTAKYPGKIVGMYAYNEHSPPPSIEAHPQVVIGIATGFIKGGYTMDQLASGWSAKTRQIGIREYYSVTTWDRDLPGAARGGNIEYLKTTIPAFHAKGARYMSAESSDNWGPNGLGYYLASHLLWDVKKAAQVDALITDFIEKCFGDAREPMAKFYQLIDATKKPMLSDDLVGRMYRLLDEARGRTKDRAVHARLDELTLYTHHVEIWLDYTIAKGLERQAAFEALIRHAYRMKDTMLIHTKALYRDVINRDKTVVIPENAIWSKPEGANPWKSTALFTREEIDTFTRNGIARRKLLDFEPVAFSSDLVPTTALKLPKVGTGSMGLYARQPRAYFTWVDKAPLTLPLTVKSGLIYQTLGPTRLDLYPLGEAEMKSVAHVEIDPDKSEHPVALTTTFTGLHRVEIIGGGAALATWVENTPMTIESSFEKPGHFHGRWTLYFYVPHGTRLVGGFSENVGLLRSPSSKEAMKFGNKPGYFSVPVPAGEDGRLWKFEQCAGNKSLMTVPPYLARNAAELLLPKEVVEKDAAP